MHSYFLHAQCGRFQSGGHTGMMHTWWSFLLTLYRSFLKTSDLSKGDMREKTRESFFLWALFETICFSSFCCSLNKIVSGLHIIKMNVTWALTFYVATIFFPLTYHEIYYNFQGRRRGILNTCISTIFKAWQRFSLDKLTQRRPVWVQREKTTLVG